MRRLSRQGCVRSMVHFTAALHLRLSFNSDVAKTTTSTASSLESKEVTSSVESSALASAFLADLLQPQETIALEDATRTYRTMDVVEPATLYDPTLSNISSLQDNKGNDVAECKLEQQEKQHDKQSLENESGYTNTIKDAHDCGKLWQMFVTASDDEKRRNVPPAWFEQLCRDLYFRTDSIVDDTINNTTTTNNNINTEKSSSANSKENVLDAAACESDPLLETEVMAAYRSRNYRKMPELEKNHRKANVDIVEQNKQDHGASTISERAGDVMEVDPYLWLSFDLLDIHEYNIASYAFPLTCTYTEEQKCKLTLNVPDKEYIHFCNTYAFPERWQIPTSLGTIPSKLYVDPQGAIPVVYLQLSEQFPPAMWLPIKPNARAIRNVLSEFAQFATLHRNWHHAEFEERYQTAERLVQLQRIAPSTSLQEKIKQEEEKLYKERQESDNVKNDTSNISIAKWNSNSSISTAKEVKNEELESTILRYMAYDARNAQYTFAPLKEFRNQQDFFLGEYDEPERLLEHLDLCPFTFAIQHLRTVTDLHAEHMTPTIDGPGVVPSLYRCIYSKALLFITVLLSAEVKLPPQDLESFKFLWRDSQVMPKMKVPVFARVLWPENAKMCGAGLLARRMNKMFNCEFAPDMPIDAMMALFYTMNWASQLPNLLGVRKMRQRVAELELAAKTLPPRPLLYPSTREIPNPEYTPTEQLGMHVQYLSYLNDPDILQTIHNMLPSAPAAVRMGCAKAALIAGERELFRYIVSSEPPGRMQTYMTKIVRKRKARDLTDAEPRLLDDQYEFATPLWTKRGDRIDRNTLEGKMEAKRLRET